ncbi:transglycosylase family protein [Mycolicibacillus parakoreensis]|uniref:transglycosylase family protein n=1 Tax=Mycolicibacillus parakoreensis TaxID=1069221 RepID=UPI0023E0939C|nr:transglycosylase family protein [Mycolicibacillus parakoreensis]MCV7314874.1 transglycosylase family protein [Mycolicibacillus parakoreensis]
MTPRRRWAAALLAGTALVAPAVAAGDGVNWEAVAQCESGGDWSAATGNGDFGGLQISESTWRANGGAEMAANPADASPAEQVDVAKHILASQGPDAWPSCLSSSRDAAPTGSLSHLITELWNDAGGYRGPR